jgi:outer membrane protein TolC
MKGRDSLVFLAALCLLTMAESPSCAEDVLVLGLADCVQRALATSSSLRMEDAKSKEASARLDTMKRQYLPSLAATGSYTKLSPVDAGSITASVPKLGDVTVTLPSPLTDSFNFGLGLQQPIFTGAKIASGIKEASSMLDAARFDAVRKRQETIASVETAYWQLDLAEEMTAAIDDNIGAMRAHRDDAERMLEQGAGTKSDLLSTKMKLADAEALGTEVRNAEALSRARLNIAIGLPWNTAFEIAKPADSADSAADKSIDQLVCSALSGRSDLAAVRSRIAAQEAALLNARSGLYPNVFLTGGLSLADPNPRQFPQQAGFSTLWNLGILVSIDLGRIPAVLSQAEEASASVAQEREALVQASQGVTLEVIQSALELSRAADQLRASVTSVSLAEENLRSQQDRVANGIALPSDLDDAENALLQAKIERTRARVTLELAKSALREAVGGEDQ